MFLKNDLVAKEAVLSINVSGIAINKNIESSLGEIQEQLCCSLQEVGEIGFQAASAGDVPDGIAYLYSGEGFSLMFLPMDMCSTAYELDGVDCLTFALSESSMAFFFAYAEHGQVVRSVMEVDGDVFSETGEALSLEEGQDDTSEKIWLLIHHVIGTSFFKIPLESVAKEYRIGPYAAQNKTRSLEMEAPEKPWWKFW